MDMGVWGKPYREVKAKLEGAGFGTADLEKLHAEARKSKDVGEVEGMVYAVVRRALHDQYVARVREQLSIFGDTYLLRAYVQQYLHTVRRDGYYADVDGVDPVGLEAYGIVASERFPEGVAAQDAYWDTDPDGGDPQGHLVAFLVGVGCPELVEKVRKHYAAEGVSA